MRTPAFVVVLLIVAAVGGCGSTSTPSSPSPTTVTGGGAGASTTATQVYILGRDGGDSFRPSPITAAQGASVVWINSDTEAHRVVAADGSFDTGVLQPDAQSAPVVVQAAGSYHCALHSDEVGMIAGK